MGLDEGLYAECSREMVVSGDFVVPRINGEYFFDKPPLCYWMQAASMKALGVGSLGARLPSAICGMLLVGLTLFVGNRLFGKHAGLFAGFALASSLLFAGIARMAIMDMAFSLMISAALGAFALAYLGAVSARGYLAFWAAMGLAALVKGPAGVVLICATIFIFILLRKDWGALRRMLPLPGIIVFLAITLPWYVLVQKHTGGVFLNEFIFRQNIDRAMGKAFNHNYNLLSYLPIFAFGFFPWSAFLPLAWGSHVKLRPTNDDKVGIGALFVAIWMVCIIGTFTLVKSKLPGYILPAFPAAALLVGLMWSRISEKGKLDVLKPYSIASLVVASLMAAGILVGQRYMRTPIPGLSTALLPMAIFVFTGAAAALVLIWTNRGKAAFGALCAGISGFLGFAFWFGLPAYSRTISEPMLRMSHEVSSVAISTDTVIAYQISNVQSEFPFYAERAVLDIGKRSDLINELTSHKTVYVIAQKGRIQDLPAGGKLMSTIFPYMLYRY